MTTKIIFLLSLVVLLPSCLQTTADLRNNRQQTGAATASTPPQIVTKQQKEAVEVLKNEDLNKDFRELNGRIEVLENQINELRGADHTKALEAKVTQLETKINLLETTVAELHTKAKKEATQAAVVEAPKSADPVSLQEANKLFDKQKWDEAVLAFEEYRKANPKGKSYPDATFKIGVCFQNMGMKDDAKAFYKEVVDKFPKTKEAGLAKSKLKKL